MDDPPFANAAERIQFSQAVSYLEAGTPELIPREHVASYVAKGLMRRDGDALRVTDAGQRQHEIAKGERFSDG